MKLFALVLSVYILNIVSAKISGGPRGRFDKHVQHKPNHHVSAHHTHYSYHPPTQIHFMCRYCSNFASYPVYHKVPPSYVYKYREFGGRFSTLLTGLALYNLGRAASEHWEHNRYYSVHPDEKCSIQVIDKRMEEIVFPCFMMSSFMNRTPESFLPDPNAIDITAQIDVRQYLHRNGSNIKITRDLECLLWHNTSTAKTRNIVPCALLREYAETMKPSGIPVYVWLPVTIAVVATIYVCCQCCYHKKSKLEKVSLNQGDVIGYCSNVY